MYLRPDLLAAVVTILAIALYFYMGFVVGQMRVKHHVKAPATTGAPAFERAFRVQMNTLEHLPVFLPLLWMSSYFFGTAPWAPALLGLVWIVGRTLYMTSYMVDPEKRGPGFGLSAGAEILLLILSVAGIVQSWIDTNMQ
jgi:glutathione S-transferase